MTYFIIRFAKTILYLLVGQRWHMLSRSLKSYSHYKNSYLTSAVPLTLYIYGQVKCPKLEVCFGQFLCKNESRSISLLCVCPLLWLKWLYFWEIGKIWVPCLFSSSEWKWFKVGPRMQNWHLISAAQRPAVTCPLLRSFYVNLSAPAPHLPPCLMMPCSPFGT